MASKIRFVQPTDAADIVAIYGPYCESTIVSFEVVSPTIEQMADRIREISDTYPWLVAEIDGRIASYVYANRHRERAAYQWAVDVAVYVSPDFQRHGVGRALYTTLFSILREQGYFKAIAGVSLPNVASVGLHERMGFRPAAVYHGVGYKCGRWIDVGWWELELQAERANPAEPRPIGAIRADAAIMSALAAGEQLLSGEIDKNLRQ